MEREVLGAKNPGRRTGECKWSVKPVGTDILDRLVSRKHAVASDLSSPPKQTTYTIWSRSGFTKDLQNHATTAGILLFDLADVLFLDPDC
jgi:hypothetical protein